MPQATDSGGAKRSGDRVAYVGVGTFAIMTIADQRTQVCAQGEAFFFGDPVWVKD